MTTETTRLIREVTRMRPFRFESAQGNAILRAIIGGGIIKSLTVVATQRGGTAAVVSRHHASSLVLSSDRGPIDFLPT